MKSGVFIVALPVSFVLLLSAPVKASPARLALVAEQPAAAPTVDMLTAVLSKNEKLALVERSEIEKVYHEQSLSAGNQNYLKLGRLLGADGLLVLDVIETKTATNLSVRLIAVKPGVILVEGDFSWPLSDTAQWAQSMPGYLQTFLPKLTVLVKDAIPLSVVNLRSATQSTNSLETEKELKLLTIQRLSQEKQFFVLERQKMQALAEEKELKLDDSAFWNGSYLLEGVIDQNGYSQQTVTINARLTPPKGGAPMAIEVSGSRTNFAEVINQLTAKIVEALKISSSVTEWKPADEAAQYYAEAQWALKWKIFPEAQAAADSAWALGKHDTDCATLRIRAYMQEAGSATPGFFNCGTTLSSGYASNGPPISDAMFQREIGRIKKVPRSGTIDVATGDNGSIVMIHCIALTRPPDPALITRAFHALDLYRQFWLNSPESFAGADPGKLNSSWYDLGIEELVATSRILQCFNLDREGQKPVAEDLVRLRALARSVADLIFKTPSVRDNYFVTDHPASQDAFVFLEEKPGIFGCMVTWGCFWQEKPEDTIAMYRELMASRACSFLNGLFWIRDRNDSTHTDTPRLAAWNADDQKRLPAIWPAFVTEMAQSTNLFLQMEAKAFRFADAHDDKELAAAFDDFFPALLENRCFFATNQVDILHSGWGVLELIESKTGNGVMTHVKDSLNRRYFSEYSRKFLAKDEECRKQAAQAEAERHNVLAFEKQKQFLKDNRPFDKKEYDTLFAPRFRLYTRAQALELKPLVDGYKSTLKVWTNTLSGVELKEVRSAIYGLSVVDSQINAALAADKPVRRLVASQPQPAAGPRPALAPPPVSKPETSTNFLKVKQFIEFPLPDSGDGWIVDITMTAHHQFGDKLLVGFQYTKQVATFDQGGHLRTARNLTIPATAIVDFGGKSCEVINSPPAGMTQNRFYYHTVLLGGDLFTSEGGEIRQYDFAERRWKALEIPGQDNYQLFTVHNRLYAANANVIFEIVDHGKSTRILASTRRLPATTALDKLGDLGTPFLFAGANRSLRACVRGKIFSLQGDDWREEVMAPASPLPEMTDAGVTFRSDTASYPGASTLAYLGTEAPAAEYCLWEKAPPPPGIVVSSPFRQKPKEDFSPPPLWKLPRGLSFDQVAAIVRMPDLYLLTDHSEIKLVPTNPNEPPLDKVVGKNGYQAALWFLSRGQTVPVKWLLNFDSPGGCPPVGGPSPASFHQRPPSWMLLTGDSLFLGLEHPLSLEGAAHRIPNGYKPGIWVLPLAELDPAITAQKKNTSAEKEQTLQTKEKYQQEVLAKYDRNHNGKLDVNEKEEALVDRTYIESVLDEIDTNHNGILDAPEVIYFDANRNRILDPNEQAAIDVAQKIFAERLLKRFDTDGNGTLDRSEFDDLRELVKGHQASNIPVTARSFSEDLSRDGSVDLSELVRFLNQQLRSHLRAIKTAGNPTLAPTPIPARVASPFQPNSAADKPLDYGQLLKFSVEAYWQRSADTADPAK